jgi:hypothetical protein
MYVRSPSVMQVVAFFDFSQQLCPYFCFFDSSMKLLFTCMSCVLVCSFWGHYDSRTIRFHTCPRVLLLMPEYSPVLSLSTVASAQNVILVFPGVLLLKPRRFSNSFPGYCC